MLFFYFAVAGRLTAVESWLVDGKEKEVRYDKHNEPVHAG